EENDDPTMRITALTALTAPTLLHTLRNTPVVRAQALGTAAFRDLSTAQGEAALDAATLEGIFQSVDLTALEAAVAWTSTCIERLSQVDRIFEERTGSRGPDLTPLLRIFRDALNFARPRLENRLPAAADAPGDGAGVTAAQAGGAAPSAPRASLAGEVNSREDVVRAIDKICAYYARFEPSSPLPLMLQRCKKLVPMSFMDILKELAPNGLPQLETVVGKTEE
ncbi:MAG TPA: hypothetical protein VFQ35_26175, partial [Polyangiaceae bacterium]|nr:hypothetical protein [Polyangiaceae bacterium]